MSGRGGDRALLAAARHSGARTAAVGVCSAAAAVAALAEPAVLGRALDLLLRRDPSGPSWTLWCAAVIAAEVLLDAVTARLTGQVGGRSTAWLRRKGLAALLRAAPHHAGRHSPGDLTARLTAHATEAGTGPPPPRPVSPRCCRRSADSSPCSSSTRGPPSPSSPDFRCWAGCCGPSHATRAPA